MSDSAKSPAGRILELRYHGEPVARILSPDLAPAIVFTPEAPLALRSAVHRLYPGCSTRRRGEVIQLADYRTGT